MQVCWRFHSFEVYYLVLTYRGPVSEERSRRVQIYVAPESRPLWDQVNSLAKNGNISFSRWVENAVRNAVDDQKEGRKRIRVEFEDRIYVGEVSEIPVGQQS